MPRNISISCNSQSHTTKRVRPACEHRHGHSTQTGHKSNQPGALVTTLFTKCASGTMPTKRLSLNKGKQVFQVGNLRAHHQSLCCVVRRSARPSWRTGNCSKRGVCSQHQVSPQRGLIANSKKNYPKLDVWHYRSCK